MFTLSLSLFSQIDLGIDKMTIEQSHDEKEDCDGLLASAVQAAEDIIQDRSETGKEGNDENNEEQEGQKKQTKEQNNGLIHHIEPIHKENQKSYAEQIVYVYFEIKFVYMHQLFRIVKLRVSNINFTFVCTEKPSNTGVIF